MDLWKELYKEQCWRRIKQSGSCNGATATLGKDGAVDIPPWVFISGAATVRFAPPPFLIIKTTVSYTILVC